LKKLVVYRRRVGRNMVRSSIPVQQAPIPLGVDSVYEAGGAIDTSPHDEQGNPIWKPMSTFPVEPMTGTIVAGGSSKDSKNPPTGRTINLDLGDGSIVSGIVQGYYIFPDGIEYVQISAGQNIYRRPSANVR
jgi:hypothetical protein